MVTALRARVVASARKFFRNTLHRFGMIDCRYVRLIFYVNLVQHYVLLAILLALLACAVNADVPVHAVPRLKVIHLLTQTVLLLYYVVLDVGGGAHVVANEIASVVDQFLLPLLLGAVNT